MNKRIPAMFLCAGMTFGMLCGNLSVEALASSGTAPSDENCLSSIVSFFKGSDKIQPASRIVDGVDTRPRAIITTDLECDDMNSLIHLSLFFNDVDVDGVVYSASQFHFNGDGVHTLAEVTPHYSCEGNVAGSGDELILPDQVPGLKSFRPMELGWIEDLWDNEYREAYEYLSQNSPNYPTPDYLLSVTKVGNVQFEGDVRFDTEGSDLIKNAILDDDPRTLYVLTWGGFNTTARALLSIADDYRGTDQWDAIYNKVCSKVVAVNYTQDYSYYDHIVQIYPDLQLMELSDGYAGYFTANNAQADVIDTFNSEWLTQNIKFNHGSLMNKYGLMGDGTYYEGEVSNMQYGQMLRIDWGGGMSGDFDAYDFMSEGDSGTFMALIDVGLRGMESREMGKYGTLAGTVTYKSNDPHPKSFIEKMMEQAAAPVSNYNPVTGQPSNTTNRYLRAYQEEWAARADWCVMGYEEANHAPIVSVAQEDITAQAGTAVPLSASVTEPDGDGYSVSWFVDPYVSSYSGASRNLQVWNPMDASTSFTIPADAAAGDVFCITLTVQDDASARMTRYAQVLVTVA